MEIDNKLEKNGATMPKNIAQPVTGYFSSGQAKKIRRFRSAFTTEQIQCLEKEFRKFPYIGSGSRKEVSTILNIPERAVKIWFQNRRMKEKKEVSNTESIDEEKNKINIRQGQKNIKNFNPQSHCSQPYTPTPPKPTPSQSQLRTTYPDPSITKASIKHFSGDKNICASKESPNSIKNNQKIEVKNLNNRNSTETPPETSSRIVNKVASVAHRHINDKEYAPMKMVQNKHICINEVLASNPELEHGKVKQENPQDLTSETQSSPQFAQPKLYQINPSHEQRFMPLHVPTLQPPPFVPGNIVWKPVNMMPVLSGIATPPHQIVHNNSLSLMHPHFPKEDCKCNCNASQDMSPFLQSDGRLHLQPQYVLAMPFKQNFERI